jgi:hypothetical protein
MRSKQCLTLSGETLSIVHRVMKEQSCSKSRAIDYLAKYYSDNESIKHKSDVLAEEIATKIMEKQKERDV